MGSFVYFCAVFYLAVHNIKFNRSMFKKLFLEVWQNHCRVIFGGILNLKHKQGHVLV